MGPRPWDSANRAPAWPGSLGGAAESRKGPGVVGVGASSLRAMGWSGGLLVPLSPCGRGAGGEGSHRALRIGGRKDGLDHPLRTLVDVRGREPEDAEALRAQPGVARSVLLRVVEGA